MRPQITTAGLAVLWISAGIGAAGALRFDGVLILLGVTGLAVVGLARWMAPRNLRGIQVSRRLPRHVFAGDSFEIVLTLQTEEIRKFDGFQILLRDVLLPKRGRRGNLWAGRIPAGGGEVSGVVRARLFRRGTDRRRKYTLKSAFPLGLFAVELEEKFDRAEDTGLIVLPRPFLPENLRRELDLAKIEMDSTRGLEPDPGGDFRGVRAWRPGDSPRAIHWPATVRMGSMNQPESEVEHPVFTSLMVRDWDPPGPKPQRFGILLHSWSSKGVLIRPDRFEVVLRIIAGLLVYCREASIPVWLSVPFEGGKCFRIPDRDGFTEAFTSLALARRTPCRKLSEIRSGIQALEDCERIYVVSDAPVRSWRRAVNATPGRESNVICVDADAMKIERPALRLRSLRKTEKVEAPES